MWKGITVCGKFFLLYFTSSGMISLALESFCVSRRLVGEIDFGPVAE